MLLDSGLNIILHHQFSGVEAIIDNTTGVESADRL